ncbi:MAG TPA: hypothetical protein VIW67_18625 [Terriglobales bacterium]
MAGSLPDEMRPVFALLDAYDWLRLIDGETALRTNKTFRLLISSELRPALRSWYRRSTGKMNPGAIALHAKLEQAIGERLPLGAETLSEILPKVSWWLTALTNSRSSLVAAWQAGKLDTWTPVGERRAFQNLIAPEHRQGLKVWYSQQDSISRELEIVRQILGTDDQRANYVT